MRGETARKGSGYIIILIFSAIMAIFFLALGRFKSGAETLRSKSARDYIATTIAETGLNCVIGELKFRSDSLTHWYYDKRKSPPWQKPTAGGPAFISKFEDVVLDGVKDGSYQGKIYNGRTLMGIFKARCAPVYGAKENRKTKTLKEAQIYSRVEVVARAGADSKGESNSYRRIVALLEKRSPAFENVLYDGEWLDTGFGPYSSKENIFTRGRLYGYQGIDFCTTAGGDKGSDIAKCEKIESAGTIRALKSTAISFGNEKSITLSASNDSTAGYLKFKTYDGYLVDGAHGGHPFKFTRLPRERVLKDAQRYKKSSLIIENKTSLPESKWKNPYENKSQFYDLNFGDYRAGQKGGSGSEDENPPEPGEDEEGGGGDAPAGGSDDPPEIAKLGGSKLLIYSKVPLRIWGCPDRTVTIYSEGDIVMAGDFNQNPITTQDYPDTTCQNYQCTDGEKKLACGKGGNKVGALIMSEGRIFIDVSRPTLYLKNEMKPYFLFALGMSLNPTTPKDEDDLRKAVGWYDKEKRTNLNLIGKNGITPVFGGTYWLKNHPMVDEIDFDQCPDALMGLRDFLLPGLGTTPHFGIRDTQFQKTFFKKVIEVCRNDFTLTTTEQDDLWNLAWAQGVLEEESSPQTDCGPMGLAPFLFDEAQKKQDDGIYPPEITINAALVSSSRRSSHWKSGSANPKCRDEFGNVAASSEKMVEFMKKPRFIIQRVYGNEIRLACSEPKYYVTGEYCGGEILRRRIWDETLYSQAFKPRDFPFSYNILSFSEEAVSKDDFEKF